MTFFGAKIVFFREKFVTLRRNKTRLVMTAVQIANMKDEIMSTLETLLEDESMLNRVAKYVRKLKKEREDLSLMSKEEFIRKIESSKKEALEGKVQRIKSKEQLSQFLNSL